MRTFFAFLVLLAVSGQKPVRADDKADVGLIMTAGVGGEPDYEFAISKSRFAALPDWQPESPSVPLQPQQAAQLALARWKALYPSAPPAHVASIELSAIHGTAPSGKWMYCVHFELLEGGKPSFPKTAVTFLVVLLDGSVVDPVIPPWSHSKASP